MVRNVAALLQMSHLRAPPPIDHYRMVSEGPEGMMASQGRIRYDLQTNSLPQTQLTSKAN